jgi:hypothetical protein
MALSLFIIFYGGLILLLNLTFNQPNGYYVMYPTYIIVVALTLFLVEFFLFFYLLSLGLEVKKRIELKSPIRIPEVLVTSLKKYPKFLISTIFQLFVVFGGLVLIIVPGVYFGVRSMFFNIETHNGDVTLSTALKDSIELTKGHFIKGVTVFLFYLVIFFLLIYGIFEAGTGLLLTYLGDSIVLSFLILAYTFSADALYHLLKTSVGNGIKSQLFRRIAYKEN